MSIMIESAKPYPNFHAARVRDPKDFEHIVVLTTLPNGIMIYGGPLKSDPSGPTKPQAYRFPRDKFTIKEAKKWLKDHNIDYLFIEPATGKSLNMIDEHINGGLPQKTSAGLIGGLFYEKTAEYFYQSLENWGRIQGYPGLEKWAKNEAKNEKKHFKKLTEYLADWGVYPPFPLIDEPERDFLSIKDALQKAYKMEYDLLLYYNETSKDNLISHLNTFDFLTFYRNVQDESVRNLASLITILDNYSEEYVIYFDNTVLGK
jgi:ferritin